MSGADDTLDDLAQEFVRRLRAGDDVEPATYARAHPALADRIHELFPVLVLMEGLKPSAATRASAGGPGPAGEATVADAPAAPDVPAQIGPFTVVRELGRGGMGRVYEVRDGNGIRRALKVVHPHLLERPGFLARFLREVDTGQRVDHPGVVHTLESGVATYRGAEVPYLVLEYVEGSTLRDLLEETGGLSERLAREVGAAVAEALAAIHAEGIVHRDVKPENVVIAPDETVKVMDLGVALVQEEALRLTQTGEFVGSLLYAAPEQLRSGRVDARSDLYALGLLLFELVTGRVPSGDRAGAALARRFGAGTPPRLREVAPRASAFLERVLEVLLAPDPDRRFATAAEVAAVLREGEGSAWWRAREAGRGRLPGLHVPADAPPFVGRDEELARLDRAYAEVREGGGRAVVVVGEGGIGKSRLLGAWLQARERADLAPAVVWLEHGPGAGALGLTPLARAVARLLGRDLEARVAEALGDRTQAVDTLSRHLRDPDAGLEGTGIDRASLEALYLRLLRSLATTRPLVLVVEDLHFASPDVRRWLDRLLGALGDAPILVLATTRPGAVDGWLAQASAMPGLEVLPLGGLDDAAGASVFAAALGAELGGLAAAQDVVRSADGNPFCLIEFAEELRTQARRTDAPAGEVPALPDSVQRIVEERLAALGETERDLLSVAACCGDRFDPVLVCEAAGQPRIAGLRVLHAADRVHRLLEAEGGHYRFRHHLVQEGLHGSLPPALRAAYHTALARAREARLPPVERVRDADAHAIARHDLLGEEPARARPYLVAALAHLRAQGEAARAERLARRALDTIPYLPPAVRARLLMARAQALDGRVEPQEILALAEEALACAEEADDDRLLLDAIRGVGVSQARMGRHDRSWPYAARSVEVAERVGDPALLARMLDDLAGCQFDMGLPEEATVTGERAIACAREAGDALQAARVMMTLAGYAAEGGRIEEARTRAEYALGAAHLHGDRDMERFGLGVLSRMAHAQCDFVGAERIAEQLVAMGREEGNLRMVAGSELAAAHACMHRGDVAAARTTLERSRATCERMGYREMQVLVSVPAMVLASQEGRLDRAYELGTQALALLDQVPLKAVGARVHPRMATLLAWMGDFDGAARHVEIGRAMAAEAGVARERIYVEQAAANLLDARGEEDAAADAYLALLGRIDASELTVCTALVAVRAGGLAAWLGREDEARRALERARELAEPTHFASVAAEARVWTELLPGGNPAAARVLLEREAVVLPALAQVRLWHRLAERLAEAGAADEAVLGAARARLEAWLEHAPADAQARMRAAVPLYRRILGAGDAD